MRPETTPPWKVAVEILGAVAGLALVLYFIGGIIFAARLHALGLPIDAAVALFPSSVLLVAGVRALALGLIVAVGAVLVIRAIDPLAEQPPRLRRFVLAAGAILAVMGFLVAVPLAFEPLSHTQRAGLVAAGIAAWIAALFALGRAPSYHVFAYRLGAVVLVLGTLLHGITNALPPTEMDFASVRLKSGHVTDGYYLAADANMIYLALNVGTRSIGRVTGVARSDITTLSLDREQTDIRPVGTELPKALAGEFASLPAIVRDKEQHARRDYLHAYGAEIRTGPAWRFPPVLPVNALEFLLKRYENFAPTRAHAFRGAERVPLDVVAGDPHLYVGRAFVIRGVVVSTAFEGRNPDGSSRRLVIIRPQKDGGRDASCTITRRRPFGLSPGTVVDVHATVVAWGSFNIRAGDTVERTILACSAARPVEQPERS